MTYRTGRGTWRRTLLATSLILLITVTGQHAQAKTPSVSLAGVHVAQGQFVDASGRTVLLRGINAVGKEGSQGTGTPNLTERDATRIAAMGFNVVRLGMTWDAVEPTHGHFNDAFLGRFSNQLDLLRRHGLLAIIDMHQDTWSAYLSSADGAPRWAGPQCHVPPHLDLAGATGQFVAQYLSPDNQAAWQNFWADGYGPADPFCTGAVQTAFVRMWTHVAQRLGRHPAVLGYDLLNEPFPGSAPGAFEIAQLSAFYQRTAAAIRTVDHTGIIFFEPPIGAIPAPALAAPDPNSAFAPHIYTETMFSGGAFTTGARSDAQELAFDRAEADRMGTALWVGEWGEVEQPTYDSQMYDLFDSTHTSDAFWAYTQGGNDHLKSRDPAVDLAHTRPYPLAWDGTATWTYSPSQRLFTLSVTVGPGTHQILLALPKRLHLNAPARATTCDADRERCVWTVTGPGIHTFRAHA